MNNIICEDKIIVIDKVLLNPDVTFDCGQCFRWDKKEDGSWSGIVKGHLLNISQDGNNLIITGTDKKDFDNEFRNYFDLDRNYDSILTYFRDDPVLSSAIDFAGMIRILNQDPWETLCSFIISQNNNIPRIKGIVSRLCENFGEEFEEGLYSFPDAETIASLSVEELSPLRSGFRAKYIIDAARKVAEGEVSLEELKVLPLDEARQSLQKIKGVGPKVADCALLFGCGRIDAFPIDVWIKRVLKRFYPQGFPEKFKEYGGIAQQYLFYYARWDKSVADTF